MLSSARSQHPSILVSLSFLLLRSTLCYIMLVLVLRIRSDACSLTIARGGNKCDAASSTSRRRRVGNSTSTKRERDGDREGAEMGKRTRVN